MQSGKYTKSIYYRKVLQLTREGMLQLEVTYTFSIIEIPVCFEELSNGDSFCYRFTVTGLRTGTLSLPFTWSTKLDKVTYFTSDGIKMKMASKFRESKMFYKVNIEHKMIPIPQPKPCDAVLGGQ